MKNDDRRTIGKIGMQKVRAAIAAVKDKRRGNMVAPIREALESLATVIYQPDPVQWEAHDDCPS